MDAQTAATIDCPGHNDVRTMRAASDLYRELFGQPCGWTCSLSPFGRDYLRGPLRVVPEAYFLAATDVVEIRVTIARKFVRPSAEDIERVSDEFFPSGAVVSNDDGSEVSDSFVVVLKGIVAPARVIAVA